MHQVYADRAQATYAAMRHAFYVSRQTGLSYNAVREDGSVDTNAWSYNQGVMLDAHVLHHCVSGELQSLRFAESIAEQTLQTFGDFTARCWRGIQPSTRGSREFSRALSLGRHTSETCTSVVGALACW